MQVVTEVLNTDILIIGGGTAGCLAAVEAREKNPQAEVLIIEKAHIDRSGCLAAGMNAINVYMNPGETPESFVRYVRSDAMGLVREDLVKSMAEEINAAVKRVEEWGLPIKKDPDGKYSPRGRWNIKINGESLKPIIAEAARKSGAKVLNRVIATNYILDGNRVAGAYAFGVRENKFYVINAKATICATGGAAGIYKPNNDGSAHHKMWYCPYDTGAGYAMGIRAGAEMTSFEMRFIALRTKDVISPTGTLALGFGAPQVNAKGEKFMEKRFNHVGGNGAPTPYRVYAPTMEVKEGRGPCYMDTRHLSPQQVHDLKASFLDMYPNVVLFWASNEIDPSKEPIEIQGTEPYLVGGHCQAGYWINTQRETTLTGLYAAGDVAGGAPYKFVSGCWAEGIIAARAAAEYIKSIKPSAVSDEEIEKEKARVFSPIGRHEEVGDGVAPREMEERLQRVMDQYAGGVNSFYEMNEERLQVAKKHLQQLQSQKQYLMASDLHDLMAAHEIIDRVDVAQVLVEHLIYRRETRWPSYQSRLDFPNRDDFHWLKFVNSVCDKTNGGVKIIERPYQQMVSGDRYLPR
ncbi:MAG: adenylyl-sulfate reductase subunit alpha [Candidatus Schekmanbacteria bacterium]|nr:adenylyl-sulfate reductase subunit alpha [Candidatus Schekmanbacteria bacterium]